MKMAPAELATHSRHGTGIQNRIAEFIPIESSASCNTISKKINSTPLLPKAKGLPLWRATKSLATTVSSCW